MGSLQAKRTDRGMSRGGYRIGQKRLLLEGSAIRARPFPMDDFSGGEFLKFVYADKAISKGAPFFYPIGKKSSRSSRPFRSGAHSFFAHCFLRSLFT